MKITVICSQWVNKHSQLWKGKYSNVPIILGQTSYWITLHKGFWWLKCMWRQTKRLKPLQSEVFQFLGQISHKLSWYPLLLITFNPCPPPPPSISWCYLEVNFFFFFYLFSLHWPKESCLHLVYSEKWNFIQWRWRGCSPALENILLLFI